MFFHFFRKGNGARCYSSVPLMNEHQQFASSGCISADLFCSTASLIALSTVPIITYKLMKERRRCSKRQLMIRVRVDTGLCLLHVFLVCYVLYRMIALQTNFNRSNMEFDGLRTHPLFIDGTRIRFVSSHQTYISKTIMSNKA